jgi:hypothetical protein
MTVNDWDDVALVIAGNGYYPGDEKLEAGPIVRIVEYTNAWGGRCWGEVYQAEADAGRLHRYEQVSDHIKDPVVIWTRPEYAVSQ